MCFRLGPLGAGTLGPWQGDPRGLPLVLLSFSDHLLTQGPGTGQTEGQGVEEKGLLRPAPGNSLGYGEGGRGLILLPTTAISLRAEAPREGLSRGPLQGLAE